VHYRHTVVRAIPWPSPLSAPELDAKWVRLSVRVGADPRAAASLWRAIDHAYTEPWRQYHTMEHLGEAFALLDVLVDGEPSPALELAVWAHDMVYDPTRRDNEVASARWARVALAQLGVDPGCTDQVATLVLTTFGHDPRVDDGDARLLSDVDLAILAAPAARYARYVTDVRAEYAHLDDDAWRRGRTQVIGDFLSRTRLFHHPRLRHWDDPARRNLYAELDQLCG
jgi:predicted metal-dependent HD superfamily phosphohydrolase